MTKVKRKGDGPVPGVRNWMKGRVGTTRHSAATKQEIQQVTRDVEQELSELGLNVQFELEIDDV